MAADTRTGIVTGGSGGIGQVPAERLARDVRVVIAQSGNRSRAEEVVVATGAAGGDTAPFRADVSNGDEVAKLFDIADTVRVRKPVATEPLGESGSVDIGHARDRSQSQSVHALSWLSRGDEADAVLAEMPVLKRHEFETNAR